MTAAFASGRLVSASASVASLSIIPPVSNRYHVFLLLGLLSFGISIMLCAH